MEGNNTSLRKKILTWLMPLMLLLIVIDSTLLNNLALGALEKELDSTLYSSAKDIAEYLNYTNLDVKDFEMLDSFNRILLKDDLDNVIYSVCNDKGLLLGGDLKLSQIVPNKVEKSNPQFFSVEINQSQYRIVRAFSSIKKGSSLHQLIIQVATTTNRRNALASKILIGVVLPQLLLVLLTYFVILSLIFITYWKMVHKSAK